MSPDEADNRGWGYKTEKSYLFTLCNDFDIDGCYIGNKTRFINHGANKEANVSVKLFYVNGRKKKKTRKFLYSRCFCFSCLFLCLAQTTCFLFRRAENCILCKTRFTSADRTAL